MAAIDLERARQKYPSTQMGVDGWLAFFETPAGQHSMGRIIGDIYAEIVSQEEKEKGIRRMGRRPRPAQADWATVHAAVFPANYTNEPFRVAFRQLLQERGITLRNFAKRVPVHPSTLSRLLNGAPANAGGIAWEPTLEVMAVVAEGCRVKPGYFVEYRAKFLAEVLQKTLIRQPHLSITMLQGLKRDREAGGK